MNLCNKHLCNIEKRKNLTVLKINKNEIICIYFKIISDTYSLIWQLKHLHIIIFKNDNVISKFLNV